MQDENKEMEEVAEVADALGDAAEVDGVVNVAAGLEDIATAEELEGASKEALAPVHCSST